MDYHKVLKTSFVSGNQRKQSLEHGKTDKIKHKKHAFAAIDTCV